MAREPGLDALRAALTILVVLHHTALTYGAVGGWYYREVPLDGRLETKLLIFFCTLNQAYFMGLFFLLAGYFTPGAVARHGAWGYLRERVKRLGLPLLAYVLLIGPVTVALAQTAKGRSFVSSLVRLWQHGGFENGPLWFCQALLMFDVGYLAWRAVAADRVRISRAFPSHKTLAAAALLTGAGAFALRLVWPVGTQVYGLQAGYFASYLVLYAGGCLGARSQWLISVPARPRLVWLIVACVALPVLPGVVLLAPQFPGLGGNVAGGWNVQAVVYAFWEPAVAWGVILALLHSFVRRFRSLGVIWSALARRAYTIFIIHPPILVAVALAFRPVSAPHLVKFAVIGLSACLACFWCAGLLLRVPAVRRVV